jgi:hypothetical protein
MCSNHEVQFYICGNMWRTVSDLKHEITVKPRRSEGSSNDDNDYDEPARTITIQSSNFHTKQHNFTQFFFVFYKLNMSYITWDGI